MSDHQLLMALLGYIVGRDLTSPLFQWYRTRQDQKRYNKRMEAFHEQQDRCTVCHRNYVDSAAGFDTCEVCLKSI